MHTYSDLQLVTLATELAQQAAEVINKIRSTHFKVEKKADSSPVTEADQAAEKIILAGLRKYVPAIPIIAEEEVAAGKKTTVGSEFWLIDPLDGTREFVRGNDHFTVNIGLIRDNKPILGAVALPAYQTVYYGIVGQGAWRTDAQGTTPIHVSPFPKEGFRVATSRHYANDPKLKEFLQLFPVSTTEQIGSAAKIIYIAEGKIDMHPRFNPTMEWDTAAPQAILEAAGGMVRTFDNQPLHYGKKDWLNGHFFCSSTPIDCFLDKKNT